MNWKWKIVLILALAGNLFFLIRAMEYRSGANDWRDRYARIVGEFSGRKVYEQQNRAYHEKSSEKRIVFIGTQMIERWNLTESFPEFEAINRGIYGQWAAGLLLRFKPDVIDLNPKLVFIEVSSYNIRPQSSLREIEDYVISMVDLAKAHQITPILSTMIPLLKGTEINVEGLSNFDIRDSIRVYNEWLIDYCRNFQINFIDLYGILSDSNGNLLEELSQGPIDPNQAGYDLMTLKIRPLLHSLFSEKSISADK